MTPPQGPTSAPVAEYFGKHHSYLLPQDNYYTRKISNKLRDALPLKIDSSILEIGCGAGRFSLPLLDQGFSMTCIDMSKELVDVFLASLKKNHKAQVLAQDLFAMTGSFDFVIGFFVLHHFDDHGPLFDKIKTLLKPGGSIAFIEPNPYNPLYYVAPLFYEGIHNKDEHYFMCDKGRITRALEHAGFKNVRVEKFGFLPPQIINLKFGDRLDRLTEKGLPRLCHLIVASL